ncbi:MFS transporter [Ilumatobacter coccineus]|uniref:Putative major facilitator superfamily transporter n=1 Tax=Ilumatobacter coccineus (strain NBRC 103263 / KCTC 29153 / YM16-304) TaxID=1313172 RepID=A0A6C7DYT1_ILUCY|nr:MFS transporter [Ilumatobacter coccineus]BAN01394.1 putative major facilitator superfamily transporter [Ilumatobacter coccineus YM16-304]
MPAAPVATTAVPDVAPPSPLRMLFAFGGLMATLAAGYGVLFTIVDDYKTEYGISESSIGIVIGLGFLSGFLSQVLIAPYADRGHARTIVLVGVGVNVVGLLLMALGTTLTPILIGRFISGLGIGAASPAVRRIVILADPDNLGSNLGRLLSADVFGFAMGPAISAALVGPFGIAAPFIVISVVAVVLLPFVARVPVDETAVEARPRKRLAFDLLRSRPFAGATVLAGVTFVMIGGFDALWALVHDELGTAEWIANLGITLFAIPLVILGPFAGRTAQTFGPFRLSAIGLFAGAGFLLGYGLLPTGGLIFALAMMHAVSDGMTISGPGVAAGMLVPADRQAGAQGMLGATQAIMAGIMAVVTGFVYEHAGRTVAYGVVAGVMVVLTCVGLWLAGDARSLRRPLYDGDGDASVVADVAPLRRRGRRTLSGR